MGTYVCVFIYVENGREEKSDASKSMFLLPREFSPLSSTSERLLERFKKRNKTNKITRGFHKDTTEQTRINHECKKRANPQSMTQPARFVTVPCRFLTSLTNFVKARSMLKPVFADVSKNMALSNVFARS